MLRTLLITVRNLGAAFVIAILLSACWLPENYDAKIEVRADASYSFKYDGVLTYASVFEAAANQALVLPPKNGDFKMSIST